MSNYCGIEANFRWIGGNPLFGSVSRSGCWGVGSRSGENFYDVGKGVAVGVGQFIAAAVDESAFGFGKSVGDE